MHRTLSFLLALLFLAAGAPFASADHSDAEPLAQVRVDAAARGTLRLAWEAYDAGRCDEVLGYVKTMDATSSSYAQALWLRVGCLYDMGRYDDAVQAMESDGGGLISEREAIVADIVQGWVGSLSAEEKYTEALEVLERGLERAPEDALLHGLRETTLFRARVRDVALARLEKTGGDATAQITLPDRTPPGKGWLRVIPPMEDYFWVARVDVQTWLGTTGQRISERGRWLWVRTAPGELEEQTAEAAVGAGISLKVEEGYLALSREEETVYENLERWRLRAALEGSGAKGAAAEIVDHASWSLKHRVELLAWLDENKHGKELQREANLLIVRDPITEREFALEPGEWAELFVADPDQWERFWSELTTDLSRPARAFHCFCGREAVLRETMSVDGRDVLVVDRAGELAVIVEMLCPYHRAYVTERTLAEWGVGPEAVQARTRSDALQKPWDLLFARGESQGIAYLIFNGEGASGLARDPTMLLGALEAVDAEAHRETRVRVWAPSASALVVSRPDAPDQVGNAGMRQLFGWSGGADSLGVPLGYNAKLKLPSKGVGTFRMQEMQ